MKPLTSSDPGAIGGIDLYGRLGEGGMGRVYFGVTPDDERVAVKVVPSVYVGNEDRVQRFAREIQAMHMVQGPGAAALVDAAPTDESPPWLAMEFVPGLTLSDYVTEHRTFDVDQGVALGLVLAEALADIHAVGVLHRDLKPSNVMLGPEGPRVIDFGLVSIVDQDSELTSTGTGLGTPVCMPPEQARSARHSDEAADVYGLGCALLFALTAHYPFAAPTQYLLLEAVKDENVAPDLSGVPAELVPLLEGLLAHWPDDRPALTRVRQMCADHLADSGLSSATARAHLAHATYDPGPHGSAPAAGVPGQRRPRRSRVRRGPLPRSAAQPSPVVLREAKRLRRSYA